MFSLLPDAGDVPQIPNPSPTPRNQSYDPGLNLPGLESRFLLVCALAFS